MGVSIWEGSKAQALIDAILQTNKVDKQQGTANAGKALIVGNDGLVGVGDAGIPDTVKAALLNLLRNVAFTNDNGQQYYDTLYAALYNGDPPIDPNLIYSLPAETVFNGVDTVVQTDVNPFGTDSDWTIVYDVTQEPVPYTLDSTHTPVFAVCMQMSGTYPGIQILSRINNDDATKVNIQQITLWNKSFYIAVPSSAYQGSHNFKCAVIHQAGMAPTVIGYMDNNVITWSQTSAAYSFAPFEANLRLGASYSGSHPWKGTVHLFNVYDRALNTAEINTLLGIS